MITDEDILAFCEYICDYADKWHEANGSLDHMPITAPADSPFCHEQPYLALLVLADHIVEKSRWRPGSRSRPWLRAMNDRIEKRDEP